MKPKLTILLVFIVVAPLVLLAWLGVKVGRDEQEMVRVRVDELLSSRLRDLAGSIWNIMASQERELIRITSLKSYDADALRDIVRSERIVRQLFVVDDQGKLVHPPENETASAAEKQFFTRTERIFRGKGAFFQAADDGSPAKKRTSSARREAKQHGWHVWYWDEGINLIFWRRDSSGRVVGAELSRIVLLSDIVAGLPETDEESPSVTDGRIELVDASGRSVYGFGQYNREKDQIPRVRQALAKPLGSWELHYFTSPDGIGEAFGGSLLLNLLIGLGVLGIAIVGLAVYFFRENTREIREAKQRVTFVNQVSHELKTPLTNIRMYAELLEDQIEEEDEKPRAYLGVIVSESRRLSRLIGNVLSFGRKQQSRLAVRPVPKVVDEIIAQVLEQFEPSLAAKEIEILFDGYAKETVDLDADALEQILGNLLSNVEKYAASGKKVEVSSRTDDDRTTITVTDWGPGIPKDAQKRIFEPFFRQSISLTEGVSGTGIGLGICRDLARLHGGDVTLESSDGGCCFQIELHTPKKGSTR
ncbi:MAG: HAMP domain-containing histidine kinase [Deltaproteobacteria bacterium]|nr:HAMP domain-containing histidine kinase [Deltaproteobacteria bacterium]